MSNLALLEDYLTGEIAKAGSAKCVFMLPQKKSATMYSLMEYLAGVLTSASASTIHTTADAQREYEMVLKSVRQINHLAKIRRTKSRVVTAKLSARERLCTYLALRTIQRLGLEEKAEEAGLDAATELASVVLADVKFKLQTAHDLERIRGFLPDALDELQDLATMLAGSKKYSALYGDVQNQLLHLTSLQENITPAALQWEGQPRLQAYGVTQELPPPI